MYTNKLSVSLGLGRVYHGLDTLWLIYAEFEYVYSIVTHFKYQLDIKSGYKLHVYILNHSMSSGSVVREPYLYKSKSIFTEW